ncbi:MAG: RlmE family RNA methyltransferase [Candidatus Hermodarchaeota archaeon]|nr:RlmE family RNA methyltransferase [Candidatus Hermodarchaeota archaeon]
MSTWKKNETFRKQARKAGYRSRAAFKLLEIEQKFGILRKANRIVDLCSAPGSWLQVAQEKCNQSDYKIVGVDLNYIRPIEGVSVIQASIEESDLVSQILEQLTLPAHVVLSDCSPKLSGKKVLDRERQLWQAKLSLQIAVQLLEKRGHFVTKVFQTSEFQEFITQVKDYFKSVKSFKPKSSLKRSPEMYLIAKEFKGLSHQFNPDVL